VHTEDEARGWITSSLVAACHRQGFGLWAMERIADRSPLCMCGLAQRDSLPGIDIGYALLPRFRGMGYVHEAAAACLTYGAGSLQHARIVAITRPGNAAFIRVLRSLDMRLERTEVLPGNDHQSTVFAWHAKTSTARR